MLQTEDDFSKLLISHANNFYPVVKFDPRFEKLISFDLSERNVELRRINLDNIKEFNEYISNQLKKHNAKFGYGGYDELRFLYSRSDLFNNNLTGNSAEIEEPRRLHIGIDIWGAEGNEIYAPVDGSVHSFAFNDHLGDYGATIILFHQLEEISFYTLYGHLSRDDIKNLEEGKIIKKGKKFAKFGSIEENGYWPPHLHFQIIKNISSFNGDYPGVSKFSERKQYLENSPDADLILGMRKFIV